MYRRETRCQYAEDVDRMIYDDDEGHNFQLRFIEIINENGDALSQLQLS